ncbi:MAG: hypothetical protein ACLFS7_08475 [Desulfosudaceae bacterium]
MPQLKKMLIVTVMALAGIIAFMVFFKSEAAVIKARFDKLAGHMAKEDDENDLLSAAKARHVSNMFAETGRVDIPAYDITRTFTRDKVQQWVMTARSRYRVLSLDFYDFEIDFPEEDRSRVDVTALLEAAARDGAPAQEVHQLVFILEKEEGDWLFAEVEGVDVLER